MKLPIKYKIALGLTSLVITIIFLLVSLGIGPDPRTATLEGRKRSCESIAIGSTILLVHDDIRGIELLLSSMVERDPTMLSAALVQASGRVNTQVGDHEKLWDATSTDSSTETQVQVPLYAGDNKWGRVEMCFRPIRDKGWYGLFTNPWTKLLGLSSLLTFLAFGVYLSFVLKQLDPQKAIPKRVQFALDNIAEGLLVTDRRGRVLLANEAFASWSGVRPEQLIGVDAKRFPWTDRETQQPPTEYPWLQAMVHETSQSHWLMSLTDREEKELTLIAHASPLIGNDGRYRGVLTSFEDVSALEHHKKELSKAKDAAEDANKSKSEFLARMSHEIRTPMNAVLGYTEVLRLGMVESEEQRDQHLATIQNSGEHLLALINDILDLSKIEAGKMDLELTRVSPLAVIEEVVSVLKVKADGKGIDLTSEFPTHLPETIVTDPVRLRQAVINLVGNAIKFTDKGGVRVVMRMLDRNQQASPGKAGLMLAIDVVDTGIGMTKEAMEKIFEPFSQADTSITRRFGGTGLGLTISLQLAEKLGGALSARSAVGAGSVFTFKFNSGSLEGVRVLPANQIQKQASKPTAAAKVQEKLPPGKILVVDDSEANRRLVCLYLQKAGVEVREAVNGKEAVEMATGESFDVILMDMHMPIMDGFTATQALRSQGQTCEIIALTADVMKDDERKCRDAGCSGFLTKPISRDRLTAALRVALSNVSGDRPRQAATALRKAKPQRKTQAQSKPVAKPRKASSDSPSRPSAAVPPKTSPKTGESSDNSPIECTLWFDDPEFIGIVEAFVTTLDQKVPEMRQATKDKRFDELVELAHWLKGSGGTIGFGAFTEPAAAMEAAAESKDLARVESNLLKVENLQSRIEIPSSPVLS